MTDVRWHQRFENFNSAFSQLEAAVLLKRQRPLSDLEKQGLIQAFEFTHELAWNTLKDYLTYQGIASIIGSRDAAREAFQKGIVQDGDAWMEMIKSRNQTSHTYNKKIAEEIVDKISFSYFEAFKALKLKLEELKQK